MAGTNKKGVQGFQKKIIDYARLRKLAKIQCTQAEIATVLDVSEDTLQRDPEAKRLYEEGMRHGRISVRRAQHRAALLGDRTMLIWLGKQYLGQREPPRELNVTGANGTPLITPEMDDKELARRAAFMLTMEAIDRAKKEQDHAEG